MIISEKQYGIIFFISGLLVLFAFLNTLMFQALGVLLGLALVNYGLRYLGKPSLISYLSQLLHSIK